ncbi:mitotic spindle assembly checkpoint protein 1 [Heterostelium album PN500]|uniref:Mitotic spindle assembly checkpoint protein 1 n=1 Tax=Heterostelium pallidum (strain ATCC 26659 / Pp 5 / PN500) TaxID=670386 RepID=D3B759_HETP5|nr:mitotic spindle assembly checkpoint protein 1 [Heterostelium album PN500]EFA82602.1 mitotic spindle assembly checkpoint protein 1 [Heterostelium album PN500]|eukprot:XP_020434719.1 mitotic spindle assembly checkpoint protein 1 [Heterostelium album PN500]
MNSKTIKDKISNLIDGESTDEFTNQLSEYCNSLEKKLVDEKSKNDQLKKQNEKQIELTLAVEKELAVNRSKIYELERTNTLLKSQLSESKINLEETKDDIERRISSHNKQLDDLLSSIQIIKKDEDDHKKKYEELKEKAANDEIKALEKERNKYREDASDLKRKNSTLELDSFKDTQIQSLKDHNSLLSKEIQDLKKKLESTISSLDKSNSLILQQQSSLSSSSSSSSDTKLQESLKECELMKQSLQREVVYYTEAHNKGQLRVSELESQLRSVGNPELAKFEIASLRDKVARQEQTVEKYNRLQVEYQHLLEEKKMASNTMFSLPSTGGLSVMELEQRVRELESDVQVHIAKIGQLSSSLRLTENRCVDLDSQIADLKETLVKLESRNKEKDDQISRELQKTNMFKRERDGIKRILDHFDVESIVASGNVNELYKAQQARISELERANTEKEKFMEELEKSLNALGADASLANGGAVDYKAEVQSLTKEIERLIQDNAILESRLGKGEFDTSKTKVLHMTSNPTNPNISSSSSADSPKSPESDSKIIQENHGLRMKITETEKIMERLKSVFKLKISEYREVVYALFGFKMDMETNNLYKLQSMYAEHENDYLVFQRVVESKNKIGKMELMDTDYTRALDKEIRAYLFSCHSIPAFLSQLTLDLFSKQTFYPS